MLTGTLSHPRVIALFIPNGYQDDRRERGLHLTYALSLLLFRIKDHACFINSPPFNSYWHSLLFGKGMNTLFPIDPFLPPGFLYEPGFIIEAEEKALLETIATMELHPFHFHGYEAKRKVASFGYDWSFEKQQLSKGKDIPAAFDRLIEKVAGHLALPKQAFAELLITEYPVGSVINWHRDAPPFDVIAGVSLAADCAFHLRPHDKAKPPVSYFLSCTASLPVHHTRRSTERLGARPR